MDDRSGLSGVGVAVELPALPVAAGREGAHAPHQPDEVLRLAGEEHRAVHVVAVEEGADAYGIARCDELVRLGVVDDAGELGVEHAEHIRPVLAPEREQHLAVGAAFEGVLGGEFFLYLFIAVDLAVADDIAAVQFKGLHAGGVKAHDGQAVKAEYAVVELNNTAVVGAAGAGALEALGEGGHFGHGAAAAHDGAHGAPQPTPYSSSLYVG